MQSVNYANCDQTDHDLSEYMNWLDQNNSRDQTDQTYQSDQTKQGDQTDQTDQGDQRTVKQEKVPINLQFR